MGYLIESVKNLMKTLKLQKQNLLYNVHPQKYIQWVLKVKSRFIVP